MVQLLSGLISVVTTHQLCGVHDHRLAYIWELLYLRRSHRGLSACPSPTICRWSQRTNSERSVGVTSPGLSPVYTPPHHISDL
ncbi:hypothetical protein SCLCIDRAFT_461265 [Scleroderma citrinum Foug A]|uniref:Uncharacterized protein n=1 Tax=Scleroderma citrinum Foug A TaxID=1036808 RepID=A0A0C3DAM8_9AGAM|nr:hypothetical protein SCLCIDRAFT_461265 [Scleroderma citrinum Foug A]